MLLDCGANVNAEHMDGSIPLHLASSNGKTETVRSFLDRGARADLRNVQGKTPLHVASTKKGRETVEMLEKHVRKQILLETRSYKLPYRFKQRYIRSL